MSKNVLIGLSVVGTVIVFTLIMTMAGCDVVQQRERGVEYFLGKVNGDVIQPGVKLHAPFVSEIKKYSIAPKNAAIKFSYGQDAAVTKDMQSIGLEANITYKYDEAGIMEIAKKFGDGVIEETFKRNLSPAIKTVIGKYSIYDVTSKQDDITKEVQSEFLSIMSDLQMPVVIIRVAVSNFDWSPEFDKSIQQTMQSAQEAKKAEQDLKIIEVNAQKQVKEADAQLEAQKLKAEAMRVTAQGEADARRIEGQGIADYNKSIATNQQLELKLKELEIERLRVEKWDGHYVPTNHYGPIPIQQGYLQGK
jgi:regulator of protease activity HflC (stomatin/prohibitin superfamily)